MADDRDRVVWEVAGGVADVQLNRPDKLNALDPAMFSALGRAGDALGADPGVRAVVLSGAGKCFCAGLDLATFAAMGSQGAGGLAGNLEDRPSGRDANWAQHAAQVWADLPVPVIAALHGVALGGGLQVALAADLRIVAPDSRLSVLEIRWGLVPDMTGTWRLPRLVGLDVAKELTWTGRMVSGTEAVALGLATRVSDDPHADALALARQLATSSPDAIRTAKVLLDAAPAATAGEQFRAESRMNGGLLGSPNQTEAVRAFFDKREPEFTPTGTKGASSTLNQL